MQKNIALIGFMGCGKTTVGPILAKRRGANYLDLDQYIVNKQGQSVPQLFASQGQEGFRELEFQSLTALGEQKNIVLSTGGGCVEYPPALSYLREHYLCVYFECPFDNLYTRIAKDQNRPLVVAKTKAQLHALYLSRLPLYQRAATLTVDATQPPMTVAKQILELLQSGRGCG